MKKANEKCIKRKNIIQQNKHSKETWFPIAAIAACFVLILSAVIITPMLRDNEAPVIPPSTDSGPNTSDEPIIVPVTNSRPNIPILNHETPTSAPKYYGSPLSEGRSESGLVDISSNGISVRAKLIEALPDVYTFFDDWKQYEFRLLHMQTVKLLKGQEMAEEFYYLIPVEFMTDFSAFDCFIIDDMAQFTYEYSVIYNKTQGEAEQLDLVVFAYLPYGYNLMGAGFAAFDSDGNLDKKLWSSNEAWIEATQYTQAVDNIAQAEAAIQERGSVWGDDVYIHLLKDISGDAKTVLEQIKTFENGMFVPAFSSKLYLSPEVQFHAVRYVNGFATNERVSVWDKGLSGGEQDTYKFTKARFSEDDMKCLPDLASAFEAVNKALNDGLVTPPHYQKNSITTTSGLFGWYAKTEIGVIGIIRVTWRFYAKDTHYDDAYYIVEYGSDECKAISRDDLLELFGDYETTYIYREKYNEYGKYSDLIYPVGR